MKLLPKQLLEKIPKLYVTESIPARDKIAYAKLFNPTSHWTWYIIEYDGNDTCFGLVVGHDVEFGYFSLSELAGTSDSYGLSIERDRYFDPTRLQDLPVYGIEEVVA